MGDCWQLCRKCIVLYMLCAHRCLPWAATQISSCAILWHALPDAASHYCSPTASVGHACSSH